MADNFLMKGKVYGDRKHLLKFPVFAEVKYDEIRLHVKYKPGGDLALAGGGYVEFLSYAGKPLHNMEPWAEAFAAFFHATGLQHLDMGVLVNENFNDSYRWVRSKNGFPKEKYDKETQRTAPALSPEMVAFYLFDVPQCLLPYEQRIDAMGHYQVLLNDLMLEYKSPSLVHLPSRWLVHSEDELDAKFNMVRSAGYEGLMVKTPDHLYVSGKAHRSDGWLKMKPEAEADGYITGLNRAVSIEGVPLDRVGSVDVLIDTPEVSEASPAGIPHELGADMFRNPGKYIGRWVEFKFMERDRAGGYRHPSFVRFREDKA